MKFIFQIIFKIFLILTIFVGYATTEEIKETDPDELLNQGITFANEGQYDKAIAYFDKAIEINPRFAKAYYIRGRAYYYKGWYDKAIADFTKAIEINPYYTEAYNSRGHIKRRKYNNFDGAIADYTMVLELNPRFAWAYHNRANAYYHNGQYDKACSDWRQACELGSCVQYELAKRKGECK
jgi:tetratricopeptide (TPR) repeat protein